MTTAVIGCDDGLHHDRFNLQESEWDGLLYIRSADAVLPYGITIFPYTFHYDATGFLCYVYNEIDSSSTPWGLYDGLVPVVHLPPSLVKSTEIEHDTVYRAVCRENTGIDLTVHCRRDDGDQFFFPYEYTTDVRSTSRPPPRRQCELVAVLARAHNDGIGERFGAGSTAFGCARVVTPSVASTTTPRTTSSYPTSTRRIAIRCT